MWLVLFHFCVLVYKGFSDEIEHASPDKALAKVCVKTSTSSSFPRHIGFNVTARDSTVLLNVTRVGYHGNRSSRNNCSSRSDVQDSSSNQGCVRYYSNSRNKARLAARSLGQGRYQLHGEFCNDDKLYIISPLEKEMSDHIVLHTLQTTNGSSCHTKQRTGNRTLHPLQNSKHATLSRTVGKTAQKKMTETKHSTVISRPRRSNVPISLHGRDYREKSRRRNLPKSKNEPRLTTSKPRGREKRSKTQYIVQLLMVVDYAAYQWWSGLSQASPESARETETMDRIWQYYSLVFHGMDRLFQSINKETFEIHLSFADLIVAKTEADSFWTHNMSTDISYGVDRPLVNSSEALQKFQQWSDENVDELPSFDHAMLFTGTNLTYAGSTGNTGLAFAASMCRNISNSSIVEDAFDFRTVISGAQQLARSLGARDDMDNNDCIEFFNFIMTPRTRLPVTNFPSNKWRFSTCSTQYFKEYLNELEENELNCLQGGGGGGGADTVPPQIAASVQLLPGHVYTADQQCKNKFGMGSKICRTSIGDSYSSLCTGLYCTDPWVGGCDLLLPGDGTPCGNRKICSSGVCSSSDDAKESLDTCPYGNDPDVSCSGMVGNEPFLCYNDTLRFACCEACHIAAHSEPGCMYGDRKPSCTLRECLSDDRQIAEVTCCLTCADGPTPYAPPSADLVTSFLASSTQQVGTHTDGVSDVTIPSSSTAPTVFISTTDDLMIPSDVTPIDYPFTESTFYYDTLFDVTIPTDDYLYNSFTTSSGISTTTATTNTHSQPVTTVTTTDIEDDVTTYGITTSDSTVITATELTTSFLPVNDPDPDPDGVSGATVLSQPVTGSVTSATSYSSLTTNAPTWNTDDTAMTVPTSDLTTASSQTTMTQIDYSYSSPSDNFAETYSDTFGINLGNGEASPVDPSISTGTGSISSAMMSSAKSSSGSTGSPSTPGESHSEKARLSSTAASTTSASTQEDGQQLGSVLETGGTAGLPGGHSQTVQTTTEDAEEGPQTSVGPEKGHSLYPSTQRQPDKENTQDKEGQVSVITTDATKRPNWRPQPSESGQQPDNMASPAQAATVASDTATPTNIDQKRLEERFLRRLYKSLKWEQRRMLYFYNMDIKHLRLELDQLMVKYGDNGTSGDNEEEHRMSNSSGKGHVINALKNTWWRGRYVGHVHLDSGIRRIRYKAANLTASYLRHECLPTRGRSTGQLNRPATCSQTTGSVRPLTQRGRRLLQRLIRTTRKERRVIHRGAIADLNRLQLRTGRLIRQHLDLGSASVGATDSSNSYSAPDDDDVCRILGQTFYHELGRMDRNMAVRVRELRFKLLSLVHHYIRRRNKRNA